MNTYDKNYRIKTQDYAGPSIGGSSPDESLFTYGYDAAGRVSTFDDGSGARAITWDPDGNRRTYGTSGTSNYSEFTYRADDTIVEETAGTTTRSYEYDATGRLAKDSCKSYEFDGFDRMVSAEGLGLSGCGSSSTTDYEYDPLDRNDDKSGESASVFDGLSANLLYSGDASHYVLDPMGNAVGLKNGSTEQRLAGNGQGDVALIAGSAGPLTCSSRFDPFGVPVSATGSNPCDVGSSPHNDLFYRGARRDEATGNYQFGTRFYDPSKSAFLTADSYRSDHEGQNLSIGSDPLARNTYTYVNGDPVNFSDPDGHYKVWEGGGQTSKRDQKTNVTLRVDGKLWTLNLRQSKYLNGSHGGDFWCALGAEGQVTVYNASKGRCGVWVAGQHDNSTRQQIADSAAGIGDTLSFGLARRLFRAIGVEDHVNYESGSYKIGQVGGVVIGAMLAAGAPSAAGGGALALEGAVVAETSAATGMVGRQALREGLSALKSGAVRTGKALSRGIRKMVGRGGSFVDEGVRASQAVTRAESAAGYARLTKQLQFDEAASVFTSSGQLQSSVIRESVPIVRGLEIGNQQVIKALTSDGSNIANWAKYTTRSFQSPSGAFQVHFYRNSITDAVNYAYDYKAVLAGAP